METIDALQDIINKIQDGISARIDPGYLLGVTEKQIQAEISRLGACHSMDRGEISLHALPQRYDFHQF